MGIKIGLYKGIGVYRFAYTSALFFESLWGYMGVGMGICWVCVSSYVSYLCSYSVCSSYRLFLSVSLLLFLDEFFLLRVSEYELV